MTTAPPQQAAAGPGEVAMGGQPTAGPSRPPRRPRWRTGPDGQDTRATAADPSTVDPAAWTADEAVRALYASHWVAMVRLAHLLLGGSAHAEEVVQDAYVALHGRWDRLRDPRTAVGYLRTSVVNGCRSVGRHRAVVERHRQPGPPPADGPEERAVLAEEGREVVLALHTLPRRQREVLVLRYWADASEADIAATLRITPGAVKSHASRGLAGLRARLGQDDGRPR